MDWRERIYCGDISFSQEGRDVLLMGWVDAIRDHGNILFIHLRDTKGIIQVVFDPKVWSSVIGYRWFRRAVHALPGSSVRNLVSPNRSPVTDHCGLRDLFAQALANRSELASSTEA